MRRPVRPSGPRSVPPRGGAAVVEFAVCLPLVVLLVFAPIEVCEIIHERTGISVAAYEGARRALRPGATTADVEAAARDVLTARGLSGASVAVGPYAVELAPVGTPVIVTVTLPASQAGVLVGTFLQRRDLRSTAVMVKEWE